MQTELIERTINMMRYCKTVFRGSAKRSVLAIFLSLWIFYGCTPEKKPDYLLRASLLTNENHTWYKAFEHFGELLFERSKGRIQLEVYHSEQLAKEMEAIRLIEFGVIDMTIIGSTMSNWVEIAAFCEMPYLIETPEQQERLVNGFLGTRIKEGIQKETGLRPIAHFNRSPRHLTSNRPIEHPDDLNGLILRVPSVPVFVTAWSALGAKPTPMAFSEVFTSLQQGTIEALENPVDIIVNGGFTEVQKYINLTSHVRSWAYPVIGEKQFQRLPNDLQQIFTDAALEMQIYEAELSANDEKKFLKRIEENGLQFVDADIDAFSEKCRPAIYESLSPKMQEVYMEVERIKNEMKAP